MLDKQKEVEEKDIEVIHENLDLEVKDEYNDNPGAGKVTTQGEEKETTLEWIGMWNEAENYYCWDFQHRGVDGLLRAHFQFDQR